ncbi:MULTISPECIES: aldehyde dehydrogenase family protein [Salinibaculum]|uniref:aldehyde dehydrogenase family protein n=1 Tax=Salinibaculum TaxID=2732368 RepID=UPI0030CB988D
MTEYSQGSVADAYDILVDGEWVSADSGERFAVYDPSTGEELTQVARGRETDIEHAIEAAVAAEDGWRRMAVDERSQLLYEIAQALRDHEDELAEIETLDTGKPLGTGRSHAQTCARYFEYYAGIADKVYGDSIPLSDEYVDFTVREPLGVTAQVIPWNGPLSVFGRSVAPALATGNVCIVKPAEQAPLSPLVAARVIDDHLPDGVLNVVPGFGTEAGAPLVEHDAVDGIGFTGSVPTGKAIATAAAENLTPHYLELGGKSPNVVFPDADLDNAVENAVKGFTAVTGQVCSAGSRLLLHEDIHDEFLDRLVDEVDSLTVDSGIDDPDVGPLVSEEQFEKVQRYVEVGRKEAGEPVVGGSALDRPGYFFEPTIFDGVDNDMRIAQEEIFGPVLSVITFADEQEAIEIANDVDYGLVAGIFTENVQRALRFSKEVAAGQIYINEWFAGGIETPFGGYKDSGYGREKGLEAIDEYTQVKNVCANIGTDWPR